MYRAKVRSKSQRVCTVLAFALLATATTQADIFRWDNGHLIPGTEGVTPGPHVTLYEWNTESRNLQYADLTGVDLTSAYMWRSNLTNANLAGADLKYAFLCDATLTSANLTDAVVKGTCFSTFSTTVPTSVITSEQLYSTASYKIKDLEAIRLGTNNLSGWTFNDQNLSGAELGRANLTNANLSGAIVAGASFYETTSRGFTRRQLYSTASYQQKNLQGIGLGENNLAGWDFSGQNLANAKLDSTLTGTNLTEAEVTGASFY